MLPKLLGNLSCRIHSATRNRRARTTNSCKSYIMRTRNAVTIVPAIAVTAMAVKVTSAGPYASTGAMLQTVPYTFFARSLVRCAGEPERSGRFLMILFTRCEAAPQMPREG